MFLLDEPFGALDALTRARLQDELQRICAREGITALLVIHDVDDALRLGDRVAVMAPRPGRIAGILDVPAEKPRDRRDSALAQLRHAILDRLEATQGSSPQAAPVRDAGRRSAAALPLAVRSA